VIQFASENTKILKEKENKDILHISTLNHFWDVFGCPQRNVLPDIDLCLQFCPKSVAK